MFDVPWGRIRGTTTKYLQYPSPFFDVAGHYMPATVKELFPFCRYYYLTNPIIHAAINKVAVYPITDLDYVSENDGLIDKWKHILEEVLDYRKFQVAAAISKQIYGNTLVSIAFPFVKKLICPSCGHSAPVGEWKYYYQNGEFNIRRCPKCGMGGKAKVVDQDTYALDKLRLIIWDVESITTEYNPLSGETTYYYKIPTPLANDIKTGKRTVIETTRQVFIEAVKQGKSVILNKDNLFHMKRTPVAAELGGWGTPRLYPVLRDAFGMQILRKSQEMISLEHAIPLRIIHPAPIGDGGVAAYQTLNLRQWREEVIYELLRWRQDMNYIPVVSLPLGYQELGGRAKMLMLAPEIRAQAELLLAGMEVPVEFLFGGVQWSGSNVSLRMMENTLMGDIRDHHQLLRWVVKKISVHFDIPEIEVKFKPFKMADDLQRLALNLQMAQAGLLSQHTVLVQADYDPDEEFNRMKEEAARRNEMAEEAMLSQARAQIEAQKLQLEAQLQAQRKGLADQAQMQAQMLQEQSKAQLGMAQGEPYEAPPTEGQMQDALRQSQAESPAGQAAEVIQQQKQQIQPAVQSIANMIQQATPEVRQALLQRLRQGNPEVYNQVLSFLGSQTPPEVRPLPEQRPPRSPKAGI